MRSPAVLSSLVKVVGLARNGDHPCLDKPYLRHCQSFSISSLSKIFGLGWPPVTIARPHLILSIFLTGVLCEYTHADEKQEFIEVFADSGTQIVNGDEGVTVYQIDRIDRFKRELSSDLPVDPEAAKRAAMHHFQRMDAQLSGELENAAKGLVQSMQYGIDRYPAIVFDGEAVVYGLTDISAATQLYRRWQAEGTRQ